MKLPCELIRDLLPLYAEHLTSPETGQLIEEHLQSCPVCRDELHSIRLPVPVQADAQADAPLKQVHAALRKKQLLTILAAVLAVVCALALAVWMYSAEAPATVEEARFWTYNRKEDSANLCILEVQGEGVWLEVEGGFSWGMENITVTAMHYRFPGVHRALLALVGSEASSASVTVSRTQVLTVVCADETRYYSDGQQVERFIVRVDPDGTVQYGYGTEEQYGSSFQKG